MVEIKDPEDALSKLRSRVHEQGNVVRALKSENASEAELNAALAELKARKKLLEEKEIELRPPVAFFDRGKLEDLLKQKFFYDQSFSIYGGVQGLYDYGPMGCAMKANLLAAWRQHFVLEDQLLEVDCSMLTPAPVLQASGHVDRFTDLMVKDVKTGECFRADHLVKANLEAKMKQKKTTEEEKNELQRLLLQLDNFGSSELDSLIRKYEMRSPTTGNELTEPQQFNLMFATMIGPTGQCQGFLRPETAQGIFVNFQRLLQFNQGRIPFGAAQIGSAFRNEISPRSGLIRVREFAMAEIEYFVDPSNKDHPKFDRVRNVEMNLYSACSQMDGLSSTRMSIGEAVEQGIVANQTLGYFMARIYQFLLMIGVDPNRLRFRQHLSNEMAHYACDCWDAECQTSYGWIECVGCADRSCYDLTQHTKATGARLVAEKRLPEPRLVQVCECIPNKQAIGKAFRSDAKSITNQLASLTLNDALRVKKELATEGSAQLTIDGKQYTIDPSMVHVKEYENNVHVEEIVPNVIEPSFGIGRILYAVFEHSFRIREGDEQRTYLSVRPILAPYKCSLLPLSSHPDFAPFIEQLSTALTRLGVSHRVDDSSGSIGRRYARTDQIAIPYGITIDFDTVNKSPASATLRERDSMKQIRVPLTELPTLVNDLSNGLLEWTEAQAKYPSFEQQETVLREPETQSREHSETELTGRNDDALIDEPIQEASVTASFQKVTGPDGIVGEPVADDWQSVSEDLEELNQKPVRETDPDFDAWSSATETAEADAELTSTTTGPYTERSKPSGSSSNRRGKINATDIGPSRGFSTVVGKEENPISASKKSISWNDWAKAVRRWYKEEEKREKHQESKPIPSHLTLDVDEPHSPFSGYEADQEDNAFSKSAVAGHTSPVSKEHDTLYELSPADQSLNEDLSKDKLHGHKPEFVDLKTDILPSTTPPNQEPFHDETMENLTSNPVKEKPHKAVHRREPTTGGTGDYSNTTPKVTNQPKSSSEWPSVMAQVYANNCEPEMWAQSMELHLPSHTHSENTKASEFVPGTLQNPVAFSSDHVKQDAKHSDDKYHGLFSGPGWPSAKVEPSKTKETNKVKTEGKSGRRRQESEKHSEVTPSWEDGQPSESGFTFEKQHAAPPPYTFQHDQQGGGFKLDPHQPQDSLKTVELEGSTKQETGKRKRKNKGHRQHHDSATHEGSNEAIDHGTKLDSGKLQDFETQPLQTELVPIVMPETLQPTPKSPLSPMMQETSEMVGGSWPDADKELSKPKGPSERKHKGKSHQRHHKSSTHEEHNDAVESLQSDHPPVALEKPVNTTSSDSAEHKPASLENKPTNNTESGSGFSATAFHGLFTGSGWPLIEPELAVHKDIGKEKHKTGKRRHRQASSTKEDTTVQLELEETKLTNAGSGETQQSTDVEPVPIPIVEKPDILEKPKSQTVVQEGGSDPWTSTDWFADSNWPVDKSELSKDDGAKHEGETEKEHAMSHAINETETKWTNSNVLLGSAQPNTEVGPITTEPLFHPTGDSLREPPKEIANSDVELSAEETHDWFTNPCLYETKVSIFKDDVSTAVDDGKNRQPSEEFVAKKDAGVADASTHEFDNFQSLGIQPEAYSEPTSSEKQSSNDWKSVVAQLYENTVAPLVEHSPFSLRGLLGSVTHGQEVESEVIENINPNIALASSPWKVTNENSEDPSHVSDVWKPAEDELLELEHDMQREGTSYSTTSEGGNFPGTGRNADQPAQLSEQPTILSSASPIAVQSKLITENSAMPQLVEDLCPPKEPSIEMPQTDSSCIPEQKELKISFPQETNEGPNAVQEAESVSATNTLKKSKKNKSKKNKKRK